MCVFAHACVFVEQARDWGDVKEIVQLRLKI